MKRRISAAAWIASGSLAGTVFACPAVVPCVPSACFTMHVPTPTRAQSGGGGTTQSLPASLNVTLLAQIPLSQMGGGAGSSRYGWVDPQTNREYALMGRSNGLAVIDITAPTQPKYVGNVPKQAGSSDTSWREPKVYGNYAYIGVDGTSHRLQVVDLTQVRSYAGTTLTLNAGSYTGTGTGSLSITRVHTAAINPQSGFLYLAGTRSETSSGSTNPAVGLHMVDVRNPASPTFAGFYTGDDYTHETQVVTYHGPDTQYAGREIAFNSNGKQGSRTDTVSIVDVTNKSSPAPISSKTYTNARYIHQGWLTEDHKYFFQNDELDEPGVAPHTRTHLWDVRDLDNLVYKGFWDNTTVAIDHNLYVKNGFVYETNYTTGLRILKIGNLESSTPSDWLTEVAYYDTYDPNDGATFAGAWNNYPFFPSGNVAVSDINGGLFVLRPNLPGPPVGNWISKDPFGGTLIARVPEPGSIALLAGSLLALRARRRR